MKWNIVADSSIDLFQLEKNFDNISFSSVPFTLTVGSANFVDDENLSIPELIRAMKECKTASSSACPSTGAWLKEFEKDGNVIAITITSNLSGSYNSACAAKELILEQQKDKNIHVIDSLSVGAEMILVIRKMCELIEAGMDFSEVIDGAYQRLKTSRCIFALSSFDNLVKNGRMNKLTGFVANKLGLCGIGIASEDGVIEMKGIARGQKKALNMIIGDMVERCGNVKHVVISHNYNEQLAQELAESVRERWNADITILPTRGLCSYYAEEGGLIIGYCS